MIIRAIESHFGCLFVAVAVAEAGVVVVAVVAVVVEEVAVEVDFNSETSDPLNLLSVSEECNVNECCKSQNLHALKCEAKIMI